MNEKEPYDFWEEMKTDPLFMPFIALGTIIVKSLVWLFKHFFMQKAYELKQVKVDDIKKKVEIKSSVIDNPDAFAYSYRASSPISIKGINLDLNSIICGTTGSGKTILSERIIHNSLQNDHTVFFMDPKGSFETRDRMKKMAESFGKKFYCISMDDGPDKISLKLFNGASESNIVDAITKCLEWSEPYYKHQSKIGIRKAIKDVHFDLSILLAGLNQQKDKDIVGAVSQIEDIVKSDLYELICGEKAMSIDKLRDENALVYIGLSSLGYPEVTKSIGKLIIYDLANHAFKIESGKFTPKRKLQLFIDELASVGTEDLIHLVNKGRSAGIHVSMAMQCISDLDQIGPNFKGQLFGNVNNFFIGHSHVPEDVEFICSIFGTSSNDKLTSQIDNEEKTGVGSIREVQEFNVHPELVKNLNPGQFIIGSKMPNRYWDIVAVFLKDYTAINHYEEEKSEEVSIVHIEPEKTTEDTYRRY